MRSCLRREMGVGQAQSGRSSSPWCEYTREDGSSPADFPLEAGRQLDVQSTIPKIGTTTAWTARQTRHQKRPL